jgi:hypothetical protein
MSLKHLAIAATIASAATISPLNTPAHAADPFKAKSYDECVVLAMRGQANMFPEVRSACRENFPKLPSLRDLNYRGDIFCGSGVKKYPLPVTPTRIWDFEVTHRTKNRIIAEDEDSTIFLDSTGDKNDLSLQQGARLELNLTTGALIVSSTSDSTLTDVLSCEE